MSLNTVNEILDFAIRNEIDAEEFYLGLADKMDKPHMQKLFREFAAEESLHKSKLESVKAGKELESSLEQVKDLKIADYLIDVKPSANMTYQDALILAMKKEKSTFRLYMDLSNSTNDERLKKAFVALAQEEAKHKLRFEIEYDDNVLEWD